MYKFVENNVFNHIKSCLLITKHCFGKESPLVKKNNNSTVTINESYIDRLDIEYNIFKALWSLIIVKKNMWVFWSSLSYIVFHLPEVKIQNYMIVYFYSLTTLSLNLTIIVLSLLIIWFNHRSIITLTYKAYQNYGFVCGFWHQRTLYLYNHIHHIYTVSGPTTYSLDKVFHSFSDVLWLD